VPLLFSSLLFAQDTISVDAVSAMHVCSDKNPASSGPCATAPHPLSKVSPTYPEKARQSRHEGTVVLNVTIGKDGSTHDLHVIKGVDDAIDQAAISAVSQWKFEPATYEGNPVAVELRIEVNFRLETNASPTQGQPTSGNSEQIRNLYTDANEAYGRRDYQTAANLARRITSLSPQHNSAWNLLGISLLAMNQLDAAAAALETQIKIDAGSTFAYNNLGRLYWRQHKYDEAGAQFRRQIVINPQDHYAHANLAMMLRDEHKCAEAMPELEKALAITPNRAEALLAQGECDIDLGNRGKGLSELEQATSASSAPGTWNSAAYNLAKRNIELERAEKWSETALTMESACLHSLSLEHLTAEQLNFVFLIAHYWDTRGWIYFLRGDNAGSQAYVEASWWLLPDLVIGDHLGQIYEKAGQREKAIRTYAMAVASADRPTRTNIDPDDVADATQRLTKAAGAETNIPALIEQGRADLAGMTTFSLPNAAKSKGSGEFTVKVAAGGKLLQVHEISGDVALGKVADSLQAAQLPFRIPESAAVEIPLRGTLTCKAEEDQCRFVLLNSEAAFDLASKEAAVDSASTETAVDPHIYNNPVIGMRISLPDEWKLLKEEPGSFSRPHNATFGKPGSVAFFMLTREHLEATPELYQQMIESGLSRRPEYKRNGTENVKRDGFTGTRWSVTWIENGGVAYSSVVEFFTVGDEHYRVTALAPKEIYDRYTETFENMFRSVQFPMLHTDPEYWKA